jgi:hypothetical protein
MRLFAGLRPPEPSPGDDDGGPGGADGAGPQLLVPESLSPPRPPCTASGSRKRRRRGSDGPERAPATAEPQGDDEDGGTQQSTASLWPRLRRIATYADRAAVAGLAAVVLGDPCTVPVRPRRNTAAVVPTCTVVVGDQVAHRAPPHTHTRTCTHTHTHGTYGSSGGVGRRCSMSP